MHVGRATVVLVARARTFVGVLVAAALASTCREADAPAPGAQSEPSKSVTVNVRTGWGRPVPDLKVFFHDAAGRVIEESATNADGKAASVGVTPAQVTVAMPEGEAQNNYLTWTAVAAGDELFARFAPAFGGGALLVTLPAVVPGATDNQFQSGGWVLAGGCSGGTSWQPGAVGELQVYDSCVGLRETTTVLVAGPWNNPLPPTGDWFGFIRGATVPRSPDRLTYALEKLQPGTDVVVNARGASPGAVVESFQLVQIADGEGFDPGRSIRPGTPLRAAPDFADAYLVAARYDRGRMVARRFAPAPTIDFDLTGALPLVSNVGLSGDPHRPEITWSSDASLIDTDGGVVSVSFVYGNPGLCAGPHCGAQPPYTPSRYGDWVFIVPPGTTNVKAPELPGQAVEVAWKNPSVSFIEAAALPDPESFRRLAARVLPPGMLFGVTFFSDVALEGDIRTTSSTWFNAHGFAETQVQPL
jgi:hypothetical protein